MNLHYAIVDSFCGAASRVLRGTGKAGMRDLRPILWLFVDHVLLLARSPVYANVFLMDAKTRVVERRFSSLSEQDRAFWNLTRLAGEDPTAGTVATRKFGSRRITITVRRLPTEGKRPGRDFDPMDGPQRLLEAASDKIGLALEQLTADHPSRSTSGQRTVIGERVWDGHMKALQARFDPILRSYGACHDQFPPDERDFARLFVVVRRPLTTGFTQQPQQQSALRTVQRAAQDRPAHYNYTAQVILTPTQMDERKLGGDDASRLLLGQGARAIADTPLTSGMIDIGSTGERRRSKVTCREYYPADGPGSTRELEDVIYGRNWRSESIFYVPVHIAGIPWLALFSWASRVSGGSPRRS